MNRQSMIKITFPLFLAVLLTGCNIWHYTYERDIQQGNIWKEAQIDKLSPGMSKQDVATVLSSPILASTFNANRYDYVYYVHRRHHDYDYKRVTLFFKDDHLEKVEKAD
jgi:outer membrane protein assembly factor BamE